MTKLSNLTLETDRDVVVYAARQHAYRVAKGKAIKTDDAKAVAQDVALAVLIGLPKFQGNSSLKTWINAITSHKIADFYRRLRHARKDVELSSDLMGGSLEEIDRHLLLEQMLGSLPKTTRKIFSYRLEGEDMATIATLVGRSKRTVERLYAEGLEICRRDLSR